MPIALTYGGKTMNLRTRITAVAAAAAMVSIFGLSGTAASAAPSVPVSTVAAAQAVDLPVVGTLPDGTVFNGQLSGLTTSLVNGVPTLTPKQRDSIMATVPSRLDSAGKATPWLGFWLSHDPATVARTVKQPVLILQGLTDTQVSPEQADTLAVAFRAGGNKDVTLRKFPATNHLFVPDSSGQFSGYTSLKNPNVRPSVLGALADWVVRVLR